MENLSQNNTEKRKECCGNCDTCLYCRNRKYKADKSKYKKIQTENATKPRK